jgi:predicted permease
MAMATGVMFGLVPALQVSRTDLQQGLRDGARGSTSGVGHLRFRNMLVVGEVSLAFVLLIGAGLMLRSFVNLLRLDPGFRPERVLTATISLPAQDYKTGESISRFFDRLTLTLSSIPGAQAAGAGTDVPWTGYNENTGGFEIEGKNPPAQTLFHARYHGATPGYFQALGIPLVGGRFFSERDGSGAPPVMIINQSMARKYFPGEDALGKRIAFNTPAKESDWMKIVGVVGDVKDTPKSASAEPAFWWPLLQQQPARRMSVVIRGGSESGVAEQLRRAVQQLDPNLAVTDMRLMDEITDASVSTPRFTLFLVGLFAMLALTLAAVGTFGVISYSVNRRAHEFGLRMALGAKQWDVLRLVLIQGMKLAAAGIAIGCLGALAVVRVLRSLLYEVSVADPATFVAVSSIAVVVALVACYLPARRATAADPVVALRCE